MPSVYLQFLQAKHVPRSMTTIHAGVADVTTTVIIYVDRSLALRKQGLHYSITLCSILYTDPLNVSFQSSTSVGTDLPVE